MQRLRELWRVWNWLPAFRAVAETEHLPTASEILGVGSSSLSRAIRQLEDELGQPLFVRSGRRLVLNEAGERFLAEIRDAMRLAYEGLRTLDPEPLSGALCVSADPLLGRAYVVPALETMRASHPELDPHVYCHPPTEVATRLLRGQVDVVFVLGPPERVAHARLANEVLGELDSSLYVAPEHPLASEPSPDLPGVLQHAFVACPGDAWPAGIAREVGLDVDDHDAVLTACRSGRYVALLPDLLATRDGGLRPVAVGVTAKLAIVAVFPPTLREEGRTEILVEMVRNMIGHGASPE